MRDVWAVNFMRVVSGGRPDRSDQMFVRADLYSEEEARGAPAKVFGRRMVRSVESVERKRI